MATYLIHHVPSNAAQDTWAVSFSLPYIALSYARAGNGVWYVETWLTADQIKKRLAILFDDSDELRIHALGRETAVINNNLQWLEGRLEQDADEELGPLLDGPRAAWAALQSTVADLTAPLAAVFSGSLMASRPKSLRAA